MLQRDRQRLTRILEYCEDINAAISRFKADFEVFNRIWLISIPLPFVFCRLANWLEAYPMSTAAPPWRVSLGIRSKGCGILLYTITAT